MLEQLAIRLHEFSGWRAHISALGPHFCPAVLWRDANIALKTKQRNGFHKDCRIISDEGGGQRLEISVVTMHGEIRFVPQNEKEQHKTHFVL